MRFANLIYIPPQEASLDLLYLITQSLWELIILHVIVRDRAKNRLGESKSSDQASTPMFSATQSALDFRNNMIGFSYCGPPMINIGPPMIIY